MSLRSMAWASMRYNILVRTDRQPELGLRHRRAHGHVDTRHQLRLSVSSLPIASASLQSFDKRQRNSPRPRVTTPTVCPAL
eukprot:77047-Heterocapsa_arctica.AAC.1